MEQVNNEVEHDELIDSADDTGGDLLKYLSFIADNEVYAFDALAIKEIIEYTNVTKIPMVPQFIRGVTNLRGSVVPVIDLAERIGKKSSPVTKKTCIIIVEVGSGEDKIVVGVVIDAINEVFNIREADIEAAPSFGAGIRADFLSGMGKVSDRFVVMLNIDRVLSIDELADLIGQSSTGFDQPCVQQTNDGLGEADQQDEAP